MTSDLLNSNEDEFYQSDLQSISEDSDNFSNMTACKKPSKAGVVASTLLTGFGAFGNSSYKKQMAEYNACLFANQREAREKERALKEAENQKGKEAEAKKIKDEQDSLKSSPSQFDNSRINESSDDKVFGIFPKTPYYITLSVIGLGLAGFITYKIVKRKKG